MTCPLICHFLCFRLNDGEMWNNKRAKCWHVWKHAVWWWPLQYFDSYLWLLRISLLLHFLNLHCILMLWALSQTFKIILSSFSSVTQSCLTLRPHGLQHARLPCPSPIPRAYWNSCPPSQWCHPTISSCHPLLFLPSIFPSIRVFSKESALHIRWPKYWSFSFSISPSNEYSGLIPFRMDWLDLRAVQGTLKSLPQHHSSKASVLWCSAFFIVQLSYPYMTPGKTIVWVDGSLLAK